MGDGAVGGVALVSTSGLFNGTTAKPERKKKGSSQISVEGHA
jgi:hypothetical protein